MMRRPNRLPNRLPNRRRVRGLRVVAPMLLALLLAGCGVTTQERPAPIDRREVPFGLLRPPPTSEADASSTTTTLLP